MEKLLLKVISILDKLGIKYFVTGGCAVSVWGHMRSTADIDIVVKLVEAKIGPLLQALKEISKAGYVDGDVARYAIIHKGEFNFIDPETGFKVDFWIAKDDKRLEIEYKRRKAKRFDGKKVYFISAEDLILNKLIWHKETGSSRHLEDAESIFRNSKVDLKYIKKWAKYYGVLEILKNLKYKI